MGKKLKEVILKNFGKFADFKIEYNDKVTHLVGVNGSGKTTVTLTAIQACIKGIADRVKDGQLYGERFRFIGNNKATADIELVLLDEVDNVEIKIKNNISKTGNKITFEAPKGYNLGENWLNDFLNVAFLSAKHFTQLDGKEQALLLGIDTSKYDDEIKEIKTEYSLVNRELKNIGAIQEVEKVDKVSVSDLIKHRDKILKHNEEQQKIQNKIIDIQENINLLSTQTTEITNKINILENELKRKMNEIDLKKNELLNIPKPSLKQTTSEIDDQIKNAESINIKANDYEEYLKKLKQKESKQNELEAVKQKGIAKKDEKLEYIKSFDFKFSELTVDENGGLLLEGKPIKEPYFSKGELERIVAKLYISLNPDFKVRFCDDFDLIDPDNQIKLLKHLTDQGFQVITANVGKVAKNENTIILKDCKIVDSYDSEEKEILF